MDYFNHERYVEDLMNELNLTHDDRQRIHQKHINYRNMVYAIPITIWQEPRPYKPPRINSKTRHIYVPEKAKMVAHIRDLILQELGPDGFLPGFFPRYSEIALHTNLYIRTPQNFSRESKLLAEEKLLKPIVTPDVDNCAKIINDAIKSFIIYDDAQINTNVIDKWYSTKPRIEAVIYYNANPNETVHQKTMQERMERWNEMLRNPQDKPLPVVQHLARYFNT